MNFVYKQASLDFESGVLDWENDTFKVMLVDYSYKADREDLFVNSDKPNNPARAEILVPGYERGYGKSGRHVLKTRMEKRLSNWLLCKAEDPEPWLKLGPSNKAICAAIIIREGEFDDTTSRLISYIDYIPTFPPLPFIPLGGDYVLCMSKEGFINLIIMEKPVGDTSYGYCR